MPQEKHRIAEIVAIGSELTSGARLDTNSQWLSVELAEVGIPVHFHTTIADDLPAMVEAFRRATERADVVLVTGGLGPTLDDVTRQALAEAAGVELYTDDDSLAHIRHLFERRGRTMPDRNGVQAMFPVGSEPIANPRGTAPGIWMAFDRATAGDPDRASSVLAAMPGVPSEMKRMYREEVLPKLGAAARVIRQYRLQCFGQGESHMEQLLGDLTARGREPEVGITVHEATITLRITAHAEDETTARLLIDETEALARDRLGDLVFGEEDEELWDVVVRELAERGRTLSTAESGTGGLLAHLLTEVPAFEAAYLGGLVVPTAASKRSQLGLADELLTDEALLSRGTAKAMAVACRERFGSDYALAVTACPTWDPDDPTAIVPEAAVALAGPDFAEAHPISFAGDPAIRKSRTAKAALNLLRLRLLREGTRG